MWGDSPSRTHFPVRLLVVSGYSCVPPDKFGLRGVRDLSNAEDEGAEVQNKFDVELGKNRHRSRHLISPSSKLRVQKSITCQLRPDVSTDTVSQFLIMVDQIPFAEATHAQRDTAVTDTHTTMIPNDGNFAAGQLRQIRIIDKGRTVGCR